MNVEIIILIVAPFCSFSMIIWAGLLFSKSPRTKRFRDIAFKMWASCLLIIVTAILGSGLFWRKKEYGSITLKDLGYFVLGVGVCILGVKFLWQMMSKRAHGQDQMTGSHRGERRSNMFFPTCRKCSKTTSKAGNYTNMYLSGILDPEEFDKKYGMMCGDHAAEVTEIIMKDKNLSHQDLAEANRKALVALNQELAYNR